MAEEKILISDFSGGQNNRLPSEKLQDDEFSVVSGFFHERGSLRSNLGLKQLGREIVVRDQYGYPVMGLMEYYGSSGDYHITKAGYLNWIGVTSRTTISGGTLENAQTLTVSSTSGFPVCGFMIVGGTDQISYTHKDETHFYGCSTHPSYLGGEAVEVTDFKPLMGASYLGATSYLPSLHPWTENHFCLAGGRVYSTDGVAGHNFAWDGFIYHKGRVKCDGAGNVEVEPAQGMDFSNVLPGDTIYFTLCHQTTVKTSHPGNDVTYVGKLYLNETFGLLSSYQQGGILIFRGPSENSIFSRYGAVGEDAGGKYADKMGTFPALSSGDTAVSREWFAYTPDKFSQVVKRVRNDSGVWKLTLEGSGPDTTGRGIDGTGGVLSSSDYVEYIIVRSRKMGVPAAGTCSVTVAAGGYLAQDATYKWAWRYKNSKTGYSGNISPITPGTTTTANKQASIFGWENDPADMSLDQIEVFRTLSGGTLMYRSQLVNRTWDGASWTFPTFVIDGDSASEGDSYLVIPLEVDCDYHDQPLMGLSALKDYNYHLWGRGSGSQSNYYRFSNLFDYEYWGDIQWGQDSPGSGLDNIGGYFILGDSYREPVMDHVPEGGSYFSSGRTGSNMLVLTIKRGFRVFGRDWSDFVVEEAFGVGTPSRRTAINYDGTVLFLSGDGIMEVVGGGAPRPIADKVTGTIPDSLAKPLVSSLALATATKWGDWYLLSFCPDQGVGQIPGGTIWNTRTLFFHVPTRSFTELPFGTLFFDVADSGTGSREVCYGSAISAALYLYPGNIGTRTYWRPLSKTGVSVNWVSKQYLLGEPYLVKKINRIVACFKAPAETQDLILSTYANGNSSPLESASLTLIQGNARAYLEWSPKISLGRSFSFGLSGVFTSQVELLWMEVFYESGGPAWGQDIG